ncbi:MAG: NAD(+) synthase [Candidatus Competibacteraceae bacterium]|nr:NAD(+) synthase [Candidatus Competibacteraceae bacterium]
MQHHSFHSIYRHGFLRTAVCVPEVQLTRPADNARQILGLAAQAAQQGALIALFPELSLSAYSNDDLFHQDTLLDACEAALADVLAGSRQLACLLIVGAPLLIDGQLLICAVLIQQGRILGVVPKSYLPNYREFYEKRQFSAARQLLSRDISILGQTVPCGNDLLFSCQNIKHFRLFIEVCEDLWVPIPPSSYAALAGASVIANLSASNITIGKAEYRRELCLSQSARCLAAYLYSAAGAGESTTDLAWDGQGLICENGELLAETDRFATTGQLIIADIDLERLAQERLRTTSFNDCAGDHHDRLRGMRDISFRCDIPAGCSDLRRAVERFPYVPNDPALRDERCYEAYNIQVHGLAQRLRSSGIDKLVIGVSGGLDSTHALIVAAQTMDRLELPRSHILAYTLPGFATSETTLNNALGLMQSLGTQAGEIDIRPSCLQMFHDIGHPFKDGEPVYDITFENVQAGERTSHLFRLANQHQALVLGTGDLSELALGWCTYGVGDHMSHYNVNASVPKTLIQHLLRWVIDSRQFDDTTHALIQSILDTEISPELIPADAADSTQPAQSTEAKIGPYELQDFNLYYTTRFGFRPSKVAFLSYQAWRDRNQGRWPDALVAAKHNEYDLATIKHWLEVFLFRFFQTSQFKRSCVPNSPKVGSGGSLSPRGDWRAPSDSSATIWLDELRRNVPDA